jgi:hypothetical protein
MFHFLLVFNIVSNRLWAHIKQEKRHCARAINSQGFSVYNIKRENPFEGRFLVCKVANRVEVHF